MVNDAVKLSAVVKTGMALDTGQILHDRIGKFIDRNQNKGHYLMDTEFTLGMMTKFGVQSIDRGDSYTTL